MYNRFVDTFTLRDEVVRGPRVPNGRGSWLARLTPDSPAATSPCLCTSTSEWVQDVRKDEAGRPVVEDERALSSRLTDARGARSENRPRLSAGESGVSHVHTTRVTFGPLAMGTCGPRRGVTEREARKEKHKTASHVAASARYVTLSAAKLFIEGGECRNA